MKGDPLSFVTPVAALFHRPNSICHICRTPQFRTRRHPQAVFLPPEGLPNIPDDSDDEDVPASRSNNSETWSNGASSSTLERYGSFGEGLDVYDTWEAGNRRRSVSTIRGRSELLLGADELNETLGPKGVDRLRLVLAPDEAFGVLFSWNAVISNARELELQCWTKVAEAEGLMLPDLEDIVRAEDMAPEAAVQRVFFWGGDWMDVKRWCFRKNEIRDELEPSFEYELHDGIRTWIENLEKYGVNYAICSPLPREEMERILSNLKLKSSFKKLLLVSNEDEFETFEQMFLLAAMKVGRPPGKCVIFTERPSEIAAGHETSAKVVGLIGAHAAYEIKTADMSVGGYDELVVYNVRRLFSEIDHEFMDPLTQLDQN